jgi:hypothetical protein
MGLATALYAVSTSPPMPRYREYVEAVEASRAGWRRTNPPAPALFAMMEGAGSGCAALVSTVRARDLVAAVSSFTDDYSSAPPTDLFAVPAALAILRALEHEEHIPVNEQLAIGLGVTSGELFTAVMGLHTATRVLARGRDRRLHPGFRMSLEERLERGRAIAPFHPDDSRGGDPMGDTYHFWANVLGGIYAGCPWLTTRQRAFVAGMLYAGPWLMRGVREMAFGSTLFYGNHARVDRLGLRIGLELGGGHSQESPS